MQSRQLLQFLLQCGQLGLGEITIKCKLTNTVFEAHQVGTETKTHGFDPHAHLQGLIRIGQVDDHGLAVKVVVRLFVNPDFLQLNASCRQQVRGDTQFVVRPALGIGAEEEVHRLLGDKQVGVNRREEAELKGVIAGHGVAALATLRTQ